MRKVKYLCVVLALAISGCGIVPLLPGGEPFGEVTYSSEKAENAYQMFSESFRQEKAQDWDGYSINWTEGIDRKTDVYKTEEYTLAYCEESGEPDKLWFDGWLYQNEDTSAAYRKMDWDELHAESAVAKMWEMTKIMLEQTPAELTYKYIPMADDDRHLLTAHYELDEEQAGDFVKISVSIHSDGSYDKVNISWSDVGGEIAVDCVEMEVSFFKYKGSTNLQAERKIWMFGHDCGLTPETIPALSEQEKKREWCREVIGSIDFTTLREQAVQQENLIFTEIPDVLALYL
ncbi:MAG: hypothetical protein K2M91_09055 [Lachnospiraceae bacterium]|nr:hypothetical protein [Lachnospiraceae bacterium]